MFSHLQCINRTRAGKKNIKAEAEDGIVGLFRKRRTYVVMADKCAADGRITNGRRSRPHSTKTTSLIRQQTKQEGLSS